MTDIDYSGSCLCITVLLCKISYISIFAYSGTTGSLA